MASAERFNHAVRALPDAAWSQEVRMRTGELRTPGALAPTRLRELEVHHVDLTAGYTFADVPAARGKPQRVAMVWMGVVRSAGSVRSRRAASRRRRRIQAATVACSHWKRRCR